VAVRGLTGIICIGLWLRNYINAETAARDKHLGLWQDANPTPPLEFRKALRQKWEKQYMRLLLILIGGVDISNLIDRII
jgi:hypothetical protein